MGRNWVQTVAGGTQGNHREEGTTGPLTTPTLCRGRGRRGHGFSKCIPGWFRCPDLSSIATMTTSEVRVRSFIWANFEMLPHLLKCSFAGFTVVANDHKSKASRISFWWKPMFQPFIGHKSIWTTFWNGSPLSRFVYVT